MNILTNKRVIRPEWAWCPACGATRPRRPGTACCRFCDGVVLPVLGRVHRDERRELVA